MDQSTRWGPARYAVLAAVLALHLALLAALLEGSRTADIARTADSPVQLMFLPATSVAKIRPESFRPKRISGDTGISIAPPALEPDAASEVPPGSGSDDAGGGVDWKAEARRAVQAFDIRTRLPPSENTLVSPAEETWWPWTRRGARRFKTPAGDWIVWISDNCYQIATARPNGNAANAMTARTVCLEKSDAPGAASRGAPGAAPALPAQQQAPTSRDSAAR